MALNGVANEAVKWAVSRGWQAERTKNGHFKLKHFRIPEQSVTAASTPSDHRAIKNIQAHVKRLEKQYDIAPELGRGKRVEPFQTRKRDDGSIEHVTTCRECGTEGLCVQRPGSNRIYQNTIRARIVKKGWYIGQKRKFDCCPDCQVIEIRRAEELPELVPQLEAKPTQENAEANKVETAARVEEIVHFAGEAAKLLDKLAASGLYGSDRQSVIETLTLNALRNVKAKSAA